MTKKKAIATEASRLRIATLRVAQVGFSYIALYLLTTIIMDSWSLLTKEAIGWRWMSAGALLVVNLIVWYLARQKKTNKYTELVIVLAVSQIIFAGLNVYWERGMASVSPILFVIPILTIGALMKKRALMSVTALSAITYSLVLYRYFYDRYGEGYSVQLWGQMFFFSGIFFVVAWSVMVITGIGCKSKDS